MIVLKLLLILLIPVLGLTIWLLRKVARWLEDAYEMIMELE
jgi:hypothetical protein